MWSYFLKGNQTLSVFTALNEGRIIPKLVLPVMKIWLIVIHCSLRLHSCCKCSYLNSQTRLNDGCRFKEFWMVKGEKEINAALLRSVLITQSDHIMS